MSAGVETPGRFSHFYENKSKANKQQQQQNIITTKPTKPYEQKQKNYKCLWCFVLPLECQQKGSSVQFGNLVYVLVYPQKSPSRRTLVRNTQVLWL